MKSFGYNLVTAISLICLGATYAIPYFTEGSPSFAQWLEEQGNALENVVPIDTVAQIASLVSLVFIALGYMLLRRTGAPLSKGDRSVAAVAVIMTLLFILTVAFVRKDFFPGYWLILLFTAIAALLPATYVFIRGLK